jgi:hypothetical protein
MKGFTKPGGQCILRQCKFIPSYQIEFRRFPSPDRKVDS